MYWHQKVEYRILEQNIKKKTEIFRTMSYREVTTKLQRYRKGNKKRSYTAEYRTYTYTLRRDDPFISEWTQMLV